MNLPLFSKQMQPKNWSIKERRAMAFVSLPISLKSRKKCLTTTLFFVFCSSNLWQLDKAEYFNKNFAEYEAGFSSRGDLSYHDS